MFTGLFWVLPIWYRQLEHTGQLSLIVLFIFPGVQFLPNAVKSSLPPLNLSQLFDEFLATPALVPRFWVSMLELGLHHAR